MLRQHRRSDRVQLENPGHTARIQLAHRLLGLQVAVMEDAGCNDDDIERPFGVCRFGGGRNTGFVENIDGECRHALGVDRRRGSAKCKNVTDARLLRERGDKLTTDPA